MTKKELSIPLVICSVLFFWTLLPLVTGAFGVMDDFLFYSEYQLHTFWQDSLLSAKDQGRFFQSFIMPVFFKMLPYCSNNLYIASLVNLLLFGIDFILLALFLKNVLSRDNQKGIFYFIFLFLFISINLQGHYSPLTSYPIYFSFSIGLMLLSFLSLQRFQKNGKYLYYYLSLFLYLWMLLFCELYVFYFLIIFLLNWNADWSIKNIKSILKHPTTLYVLITGIYLMVYIGWRMAFVNTNYTGNKVDASVTLLQVMETTLSFSQSGAPLYFFFMDRDLLYNNSYLPGGHHQDLFYAIAHAKLAWLVKGIIVAFFAFFALQNISIRSPHRLLIVLLVAIAFVFIPNLLISVTPKYIEWGHWENYYVYSFYSYLAIAVFLCVLFIYLLSLIPAGVFRKIYGVVIALLFFIVCVINDYINFHATRSIHKAEQCNLAVDQFLQSAAFKAIPEHSIVVTPDLFKKYSDMHYFHWDEKTLNEYVRINAHKDLRFLSQPDSLAASTQYYIGYTQVDQSDNQYLTFATLKEPHAKRLIADEVSVLFWPVSNTYDLTVVKENEEPLSLNDSTYTLGRVASFFVKSNAKEKTYQNIRLKSKDILLQKITLLPTLHSNGGGVELP